MAEFSRSSVIKIYLEGHRLAVCPDIDGLKWITSPADTSGRCCAEELGFQSSNVMFYSRDYRKSKLVTRYWDLIQV